MILKGYFGCQISNLSSDLFLNLPIRKELTLNLGNAKVERASAAIMVN